MHPDFKNLCDLTISAIVNNEDKCKKIFQDYGLLPTKETEVNCQECSNLMSLSRDPKKAMGFVWRCRHCKTSISPYYKTFFEKTRLTLSDILLLLYFFVSRKPINEGFKTFNAWRQSRDRKVASKSTYVGVMDIARQVCSTVATNDFYQSIGGEGRTIEMDETFLTKPKYFRGRFPDNMSITIFGLHCRETKETLFWQTGGKSKEDLWPIIKKYCCKETSTVCTDGGLQYNGVTKLFQPDTEHKVVYHKYEFVAKDDICNHINNIEICNRWMKRDIKGRRDEDMIDNYIHTWVYFKQTFSENMPHGEKLHLFLTDLNRCYPGINHPEQLSYVDPYQFDDDVENQTNKHNT